MVGDRVRESPATSLNMEKGDVSSQEKPTEQLTIDSVKAHFQDQITTAVTPRQHRVIIAVKPESIVETAKYLKEEFGFDMATSVTGVDYIKENRMEVVYHIASISRKADVKVLLELKTSIPRDNPVVPSLFTTWPAVEFHECETWEMLGIIFEGHPGLRRVLLPEDWDELPPMRKDYHLRTME